MKSGSLIPSLELVSPATDLNLAVNTLNILIWELILSTRYT